MAAPIVIAAVALNGAIGRGNSLPWHLSGDMRFFRETTTGGAVVMGRRTFESIGSRPLPKRLNIVISRGNPPLPDGVVLARSVSEACRAAGDLPCYICGGGQIYREAMSLADTLLITRVFLNPDDADTVFPDIDPSKWTLASAGEIITDEKSGVRYRFEKYLKLPTA